MSDKISQIKTQIPVKSSFAFAAIDALAADSGIDLLDHEIEEFQAFSNEKRKREYFASRILIKQLASAWNIPTGEFEILKDAMGCPFGTYKSRRYFVSIAHTDDMVFCGISPEAPIGIDAEPVSRKVSDRLKNRILHSKENSSTLDLDTIRLWTIKEAFIKLQGKGLRMNMNQVQVQHKGDVFFVEINDDKRAKICSFQHQDHWLAIAYYQ